MVQRPSIASRGLQIAHPPPAPGQRQAVGPHMDNSSSSSRSRARGYHRSGVEASPTRPTQCNFPPDPTRHAPRAARSALRLVASRLACSPFHGFAPLAASLLRVVVVRFAASRLRRFAAAPLTALAVLLHRLARCARSQV